MVVVVLPPGSVLPVSVAAVAVDDVDELSTAVVLDSLGTVEVDDDVAAPPVEDVDDAPLSLLHPTNIVAPTAQRIAALRDRTMAPQYVMRPPNMGQSNMERPNVDQRRDLSTSSVCVPPELHGETEPGERDHDAEGTCR
jgi:hypothetical protein